MTSREKAGDDEFVGDSFTPDQRKRIMKMVVAHERAAWFWSTVGIWIKWFGIVLGTLVTVKLLIGDWLGRLIK